MITRSPWNMSLRKLLHVFLARNLLRSSLFKVLKSILLNFTLFLLL